MATEDDEPGCNYPASPGNEVRKLRLKLKHLGEQHDWLLNTAKRNSEITQKKIEKLEASVATLIETPEKLGRDSEANKKTYHDHIGHMSSLSVPGKDPGEILKPKRPDTYDGSPEKLQRFITQLKAYQTYYPS